MLNCGTLSPALTPSESASRKLFLVGGFKMIDKGEADDKIVAVMVGDQVYGHIRDISELPQAEVFRLKHYFLTYKNLPYEEATCRIEEIYGAEHAKEVIVASQKDYSDKFGGIM